MFRRLVLPSLTILLFAVSVRADNLILSGTATLTPFRPITQMNFAGSGFSVSARGDGFGGSGFVPCQSGCSAGNTLTLSANSGFWGFSDVTGQMIVNGTLLTFVSQPSPTFPNVVGTGSLVFSGSSVVVPFSDDEFVTLSGSFSLTAVSSLTGTALNQAVTLNFSGSGTAELTLRNLGNGQYIATGITYRFGVPFAEPTPEPATIILLSTGLIGITAVYRRRRHRK